MKLRYPFFFVFLSVILLMSCSSEQDLPGSRPLGRQEADYSLAGYVESHVSGWIKPDDPVRIRFSSAMIDPELVGQEEKRVEFKFKPSVRGLSRWKDRYTIEFIPDKDLPQRTRYKCTVDIEDIIEQDVSIAPLEFDFRVLGQGIEYFRADLVKTEDNRDELVYEGEVGFVLQLDPELIENAVELTLRDKELDLFWQVRDGEDNRYSFRSEVITRSDSRESMQIRFEADKLGLKEDYLRTFTLASLHEMAVVLARKSGNEDNPGIEIEFSDLIDPNLDLKGYIFLEPDPGPNLQIINNKLILTGDFKFGESYLLTLKKGIRNLYGEKLADDYEKVITFADQKPQIIFTHEGVFNPSGNDSRIRFRSMNVKRVDLKISRVYANNLCQFLQDSSLQSTRKQTDFNYYRMKRVGLEIVSEELEIGNVYNQWLENEIDLGNILEPADKGLYIVYLSFGSEDILYRAPETGSGYDDYYTDPRNWGYYYDNGNIYKPVINTDIGLTCKQEDEKIKVFANNLLSTRPLYDCRIFLKSYQNQLLGEGRTNREGYCEIDRPDFDVFYVEAEYKRQRSLIKLNEMKWNYSTFEVGGISGQTRGIRAFIYTERGVYRPGDEINIAILLRNEEQTFPRNHPIDIEISNPRRQKVTKQVLKKAEDGFYHFRYQTRPSDLTGKWQATVTAGNQLFHHEIKVETLVAERLRIDFTPQSERILSWDGNFLIGLNSSYLFGDPASGLKAEVEVEIFSYTRKWDQEQYNNFSFTDETIDYKTQNLNLLDSNLDENGSAEIEWNPEAFAYGPSPLMTRWKAEVIEPGGRSSRETIYLPLEPYSYYAGMIRLEERWQKIGQPVDLFFTVLDHAGSVSPGKDLRIRIYQNNQYWWWEYDSRDRKYHFKSDLETSLVHEQTIVSSFEPFELQYIPETWGQYLVEVTHLVDGVEKHSSSQFFNASHWGRLDGGMQNAGVIALSSDREKYQPGDNAVISFPVPESALVLVTIEKGDRVIDHAWYEPQTNQALVTVPVREEMLPNVYCCVSVLQPHKQTDNDRPIRMYGVIPLMVEDPSTRQQLELMVPEQIEPESRFGIEIRTGDGEPAQITVAVVDEGLLSLTDFSTPDPWSSFYRKIRLAVDSYDNYSHVLGSIKGDAFKTFSVGGAMFREFKAKPAQAEQVKRFKAVSMFKGPLRTDDNGYARMEFDMPQYVGAVRVMAVSAWRDRYGMAEKTVPVKSDLMLLPTMPRMLAPLDRFTIPVEIFRTEKNIEEVSLEISVSDPVSITGSRFKKVVFSDKNRELVEFEAEVGNMIGETTIRIQAESGEFRTETTSDIAVRSYSTRIFENERLLIEPSQSVAFTVPDKGIAGTNQTVLNIYRKPLPNLETRLGWLLRYPYGCIEQSTSAAFPQLMLRQILMGDFLAHEEIDSNINALIKKLRKFQYPNGGFTYWPGSDEISEWGSLYAGHFLVEADLLGYHIPRDLMDQWLKYEKSMAKKNYDYNSGDRSNITGQVYRCFVLALARQPETSVMNYLKEEILPLMNDTQRWLLAASYKLIGMDNAAEIIVRTAGILTQDYAELGGTFGSAYRDKGMMLIAMMIMEKDDLALAMYEDICDRLEESSWMSTQALGFSLLGAGKYIENNQQDFQSAEPINGEIVYPDGSREEFSFEDFNRKFAISDKFGGETITVGISSDTGISRLFANLQWSGIPLHPENRDISEGIVMEVSWEDESGNRIEPDEIKQGKTFYQKIRVENSLDRRLENLALTQILPSGWELETDRYLNQEQQENRSAERNDYRREEIEYTDIRDDRIIYFFELRDRGHYADIRFKVRAVTSGTYKLPPTVCEAMYDRSYRCIRKGRQIRVD